MNISITCLFFLPSANLISNRQETRLIFIILTFCMWIQVRVIHHSPLCIFLFSDGGLLMLFARLFLLLAIFAELAGPRTDFSSWHGAR
ncbi:hypothetical protein, partial [Vibrio parahaemolyticus]|uniref:hypothetical protein n=1 Tax=Vibrio parahaemolyticus TaxID=670 RepID=UPI001EDC776B